MSRIQFNMRYLNNESSHREKFLNSSVNGSSVNGGVGYNFNDDDGEGEEYWRNRAYQAEHKAAAVRVLFELGAHVCVPRAPLCAFVVESKSGEGCESCGCACVLGLWLWNER